MTTRLVTENERTSSSDDSWGGLCLEVSGELPPRFLVVQIEGGVIYMNRVASDLTWNHHPLYTTETLKRDFEGYMCGPCCLDKGSRQQLA